MLVATPIGLLQRDLPRRVRLARASASFVKPILEILAGIPSIVLGFFAIAVISPEIVQRINPQASGFNILAASIARRHPVDPARRVGLRGRDAGRAAVAPRSVLRARGPRG